MSSLQGAELAFSFKFLLSRELVVTVNKKGILLVGTESLNVYIYMSN